MSNLNYRNLRIMNQLAAKANARNGVSPLYRNDTNLKIRNGKFDSAMAYLPKPANSNVAVFGGAGNKVGI
jgi:hypothetical protein